VESYPEYRGAPAAEDYVEAAVFALVAERYRISWVTAGEDSSFCPCHLVVAQRRAQAWPKARAAKATSQ
jgi:hypothetical protein